MDRHDKLEQRLPRGAVGIWVRGFRPYTSSEFLGAVFLQHGDVVSRQVGWVNGDAERPVALIGMASGADVALAALDGTELMDHRLRLTLDRETALEGLPATWLWPANHV